MNKSKKYRIIDIRSESGFSKRRGGQQEEGEERKEGERILRKREKGWKKGRESGEKGDRNFSSWRKNVRALCARPLSPFVQRPAPREDLERAKIRYFRFPAFFTFLSWRARVVSYPTKTAKLSACMHAAGTMERLRSSR